MKNYLEQNQNQKQTYIRYNQNLMKKAKNIEVAVRMRPLLDNFQDMQTWVINPQTKNIKSLPRGCLNSINISNISNEDSSLNLKRRQSSKVQKNNFYQFSYDHVFGQQSKNIQVYSQCCEKLVRQVERGRNATIFMYGQTTSGKTYTMLGGNGQEGIIVFSLRDIFKMLKNNKATQKQVYISYMEIYNQQINDLLSPDGQNLKIVDQVVQNLSQHQIFSIGGAINLLQSGQNQRSYSQKTFHDHSSRSHTIFQLKLVQQKQGQKQFSLLNLVDLAGSQRVGQEDSNDQTGYINKSLFVLSNVIHKLSQKKTCHIPFRDSKLTRVLSSSLTTSSFTVFICTISPAQLNFSQTLSTLRFANQSRKVQLKCLDESSFINQSSIFQRKQLNKLIFQNKQLKKDIYSQKQINQVQKSYNKLKQITKQQTNLPSDKLDLLFGQYKKNLQILQKEYIRAMVNLTAKETNLQRSIIFNKVAEQC